MCTPHVLTACTQVLKRSGSVTEKKHAERISPVRFNSAAVLCRLSLADWRAAQVLKRPHYLLVTLVLCNAAATEASAVSAEHMDLQLQLRVHKRRPCLSCWTGWQTPTQP